MILISLVAGCIYVLRTEAWRRLIPFPNHVDSGQLTMKLVRTACFGTCPDYSVVVQGDGTVTYCGRTQVKMLGTHTAHIPPEAVAELLEDFRRAHFMAARPMYVYAVTDMPIYGLALKIGSRKKTVVNYLGEKAGMPPAITKLEKQFDEVAGTERWVIGTASDIASETIVPCTTSLR